MKSEFPVPTTPLLTGAAADRRLDQIADIAEAGRKVFVPALNAALNGYSVPGEFAPPSARGTRAWLDGTEELRLRLSSFGWNIPTRPALDAAGLVISLDGTRAIAMVSGDNATGEPDYSPQVRYARGPVAADAIQGTLFEELSESAETLEMWFLLHNISLNGWRAELALPSGVDKDGWITSWLERIEIVEDRPDGGDREPARSNLPAPTVRWRESA